MTGSNCRPSPCKGDALPTELITHKNLKLFFGAFYFQFKNKKRAHFFKALFYFYPKNF